MKTTITPKQREAIREYFDTHTIPVGVGSEDGACTIAAINLQLTGILTDELHPCMSPVIRSWVIRVQDSMPDELRNSAEWKAAAVGIAGSANPELEKARLDRILRWMREEVLPTVQPTADQRGFGTEWLAMTTKKTTEAASAAVDAARAVDAAAAHAADAAAHAADAAADAADASWEKFNPAGLLAELVGMKVSETEKGN